MAGKEESAEMKGTERRKRGGREGFRGQLGKGQRKAKKQEKGEREGKGEIAHTIYYFAFAATMLTVNKDYHKRTSVPDLREKAEEKLFNQVLNNPLLYVLHQLLPCQSSTSQNYNLRLRKHDEELPHKTTHLTECNL